MLKKSIGYLISLFVLNRVDIINCIVCAIFFVSEADLLFHEVLGVLSVDTDCLDSTELLRFNHLNAVTLLVDEETILLTLNDLSVLLYLSAFVILLHLIV